MDVAACKDRWEGQLCRLFGIDCARVQQRDQKIKKYFIEAFQLLLESHVTA